MRFSVNAIISQAPGRPANQFQASYLLLTFIINKHPQARSDGLLKPTLSEKVSGSFLSEKLITRLSKILSSWDDVYESYYDVMD